MRKASFGAEHVSGWGMAVAGPAQVAHPSTEVEIAAAMQSVAEEHGSLAIRGAGCSYGDASLNTGGHVLDTRAMDRIVRFDPERGVITVEPGVTIRDVWRSVIFLLDYVPRWHWMTRPGGLIQFQPFVPQRQGERVLGTPHRALPASRRGAVSRTSCKPICRAVSPCWTIEQDRRARE
jgi:hypothetical protein